MVAILVALLASTLPAFFAWRSSVHSKKTGEAIKTNHGLRPGEYLEMSADIQDSMKELAAILTEHTASDSKNFEAIINAIAEDRGVPKIHPSRRVR